MAFLKKSNIFAPHFKNQSKNNQSFNTENQCKIEVR